MGWIVLGNGIPFRRGGGKQGQTYWTQLFKDYKARVEADGGTIINTTRTSQDVKFLEECGEFDSLVMFESAWGGVKKTTSAGIDLLDKWYDLKEHDAVQATAGNKPRIRYINGNSSYPVIDFEYAANAVKKLTHSSILTNDYTAIYIHKPYSAAGSRTLHAGNVLGGKLGIYARSATANRGTGLFDGTNLRFSNENPIEEKWRIDTYQPAKIFKDGTEVTYDVTANITKGELTTIGQRGDATSTPYFGDIVAIIVFNKTLSDSVRIAVENHFKAKAINLYPSNPTINQLDYVAYYYRNNKIFGVDLVGGKLLYSSNNGVSFTEYVFADTAKIQFGYIFPNGTIFFCTSTKVYNSTNGLQTINEVIAIGISGNPYTPLDGDNYAPIHQIHESVLSDGSIMICWGNYTLDPKNDIVAVFSSINGVDCKMIYAFTSGGYTGTYTARHLHCVAFCPDNNYWYINTGDNSTSGDVHWMRGVYNEELTSWSWEYLFAGDYSKKTKSIGITFKDGNIYFGSDATASPAVTELGVFYSDIDTFSTLTSHQTLFNIPTEAGMIFIDGNRLLLNKRKDLTTYYLYVYDFTRKDVDVYILPIVGATVIMMEKITTDTYLFTLQGGQTNSWILTL